MALRVPVTSKCIVTSQYEIVKPETNEKLDTNSASHNTKIFNRA